MSKNHKTPGEWLLAVLPLTLTLASLLIGVWTYSSTQQENRNIEAWKIRAEVYGRIVDAAGVIASGDEARKDTARQEFRSMLGARLALVGDEQTRTAVQVFADTLRCCDLCDGKPQSLCGSGYVTTRPRSLLQKQMEMVATCAAHSLHGTWSGSPQPRNECNVIEAPSCINPDAEIDCLRMTSRES